MDSLSRRLVLTAKSMRAHMEARLAAEGSSLTRWIVLRSLAEEDGLSQRRLAELLSVEAPTLTRHLDRMAADGLVVRKQDTVDRRVTRIHLTPAGRKMHLGLRKVVQGLSDEFDSLLSAREAAVLDRVLSRINAHLEDVADVG